MSSTSNSRLPEHRWGADTSDDVHEEFEYKTIWIAKLIRDQFGKPDRGAFSDLLAAGLVGWRAAAWKTRGIVLYVSLRHCRIGLQPVSGRNHFSVVLGATPAPAVPTSPGGGSGDEARAFVGVLGTVH